MNVWPVRLPWQAWLLVGLVCLAYTPSLDADFLNWDDPWLIVNNPNLTPDAWDTPWRALTDLSYDARQSFGAEYLPVRDVFVWLESRLFGIAAPPMRAASLLLYLASVLFLRGALVRTFGAGLVAELTALLFALHPVHAESVAWLAGQKDLLALLFVSAALYAHAGDARARRFMVPCLVLCACFSKSMSVAVIVLLVAQDLVQKRRPDFVLYGLVCAVIAGALALHLYVGKVVSMMTAPPGGSRYTALITMGPVWLRYLALAFVPVGTSIAHDVPDRTAWDAASVLGYVVVLAWLALGIYLALRSRMGVLYAFLWFFGPLLPVSQVVTPIQNRMTDRYLWLSVLTPALTYGWLVSKVALHVPEARQKLVRDALSAVLVVASLGLTFERALLFSDSVLLFADGVRKTERDTDAPLQLASALEAEGRVKDAIVAYEEVLRRAPEGRNYDARRAANALARIHAKAGRLHEAERLLRSALARFPEHDVTRRNLQKVLRGLGRAAEADALDRAPP